MRARLSQRLYLCPALLLATLGAAAQPAMPTEFPADAVPVTAEALNAKVAGKVFRVKYFDGSSARVEYKTSGYAFVDVSSGFRDNGKWRVEGSTLCVDWRTVPASCSQARLQGDTVYLKRERNGEIVTLAAP